MDQRKLMDNANTITDMAKVSFIIYSGATEARRAEGAKLL